MISTTTARFLLFACAFHRLLSGALAVIYDVSATGDGLGLAEAMSMAEPGDVVRLRDGTYYTAVVSQKDGKQGSPITIEGGPGVIINGEYSQRAVFITHSFITLKGFSVQGKIGSSNDFDSYVMKCVYVEGTGGASAPLDGFVMEDLTIENCGGECVRLRNFVVNASITGNSIKNCGIHDYDFPSEDKNGEGIYVGTSSNQWENGADICENNLVKANLVSTSGNECVDIKEGSTGNIVEDNICSNQLDPNSGCYNSRGDGNTFRNNVGTQCHGAGVRLGGHLVNGHQYGVKNSVYGNDFSEVGHGALKVLISDQADICGNSCADGVCALTGNVSGNIAETWDQACGDAFAPPTGGSATTVTTVSSSSSPSNDAMSDGSASEYSGEDFGQGSAGVSGSGDSSFATPLSDGNDDEILAKAEETETKEEIAQEKEDKKEEDVKQEEEEEEEKEEEQKGEETQGENDNQGKAVVMDEEGKPLSVTTSGSDDYGNDHGDDFNESDAPTDEDDYGNDYGDDFDADDESVRRARRRLLRGGGI